MEFRRIRTYFSHILNMTFWKMHRLNDAEKKLLQKAITVEKTLFALQSPKRHLHVKSAF